MDIQLQDKTLGQWMEHWAETTTRQGISGIFRPRPPFHLEGIQRTCRPDGERPCFRSGSNMALHVGIWATNVPDWLTFLYAAAKIGAVAVTVNTNYKQSELEFLVENADIHTLCITDGVFDGSYVDMVYTMLPELKESQRGYLKSKRFPVLKNVVYIGQEKYRGMYNTPELLL